MSVVPTRLPDRATHLFFLQQLAKQKIPGTTKGELGELTTWQVVRDFVRPATQSSKANFVDCLCQGCLGPKYGLPWCTAGGIMAVPDGTTASAEAGGSKAGGGAGAGKDAERAAAAMVPRAVFGPTTYFASHAWSYKFSDLVALIEGHYNSLPDSQGGSSYVEIFYWVDILAVTQHFTGDFKDHPDSDFPGVIRASKSVLFTMHPWRSPVAPTRVWCLFEALTAVQSQGVGLEVLLDTKDSADTRPQTLLAIVSAINVLTSQATVAADKSYIMDCISKGIGAAAFNSQLKSLLRETLVETMVRKAYNAARNADDTVTYVSMVELLKANGCDLPNGVLDVPKLMPFAATSDLVSLVNGFSAASCPKQLILSGRDACTEKRHRRAVGPSTEWQDDYYTAALNLWSYMPLSNKVLAAVGRMLQKLQAGGGGGSGTAGSGGSLLRSGAAAAALPSSSSSLSAVARGGAAATSTGTAAATSSLRPARGAIPITSTASAGRRAGVVSSSTTTTASSSAAGMAAGKPAPMAGRRAGSTTAPAASSAATAATVSASAILSSGHGGSFAGGGGGGSITKGLGGGGEEDDGGGGGCSGGGGASSALQELWLRPGNAAPPIRWRPPCAGRDTGIFKAEEVAKLTDKKLFKAYKKKQDPSWVSIWETPGLPKHLITQMQLDWKEKKEFQAWQDAVLTEAAVARATKDTAGRATRAAAEAAERAELWKGLGAYGALRVLCLHRGVLCAADVVQLQNVLRVSRGLRELQIIECEAEEEGTKYPGEATCGRGFGADGSVAPLTRSLLAACLSSRTLQRLAICPPRLAYLESLDLPTEAAWGGGGGEALTELVLAPVALGPAATRQLADVLAALPALRGGAVDAAKAPPMTPPPAPSAEELEATAVQPCAPLGYPKVSLQVLHAKPCVWRIHYPQGTTHEVLRSTRSPDTSYFPQYGPTVAAQEAAQLAGVLRLLPPLPSPSASTLAFAASSATTTAAAAATRDQRSAALAHWLSVVATGPKPVTAAVAAVRAKVPKTGDAPDDAAIATNVEVGPEGVEPQMARRVGACEELAAGSLRAAPSSYTASWQRLVPPSRRRQVLSPTDAEAAVSAAPVALAYPPPWASASASTSAPAPALAPAALMAAVVAPSAAALVATAAAAASSSDDDDDWEPPPLPPPRGDRAGGSRPPLLPASHRRNPGLDDGGTGDGF